MLSKMLMLLLLMLDALVMVWLMMIVIVVGALFFQVLMSLLLRPMNQCVFGQLLLLLLGIFHIACAVISKIVLVAE